MIRIYHIALLSFAVSFFISCKKEYSYEGALPAQNDTIINNNTIPYICPSCIGADNFIEGKWSMYNGSAFYCGIIDTAIAAPARNGFTVFGPSACSLDSGLVLTINTEPVLLNQDVFNSTTSKAGMYYYDNVAQTYPFMTQSGYQFTVSIESYIHQTKMMTATFSGIVVRAGGGQTSVQGKFKVKVH
jgi:hypothetical protein